MALKVISPDTPVSSGTEEKQLSRFEALLSTDPVDTPSPDEAATPAEVEPDESESPEVPEPDSGSEPDESENPDSDAPQPEVFTVKIDGEEIQVTKDELLKGYSRTQVFTRRTQEAAARRKEAEAELNAARADRAKYAESLKQVEQMMKDSTPTEPDWTVEQANDPDGWAVKYAAWQQYKEQAKRVADERKEADAVVVADRERERSERVTAEAEKLYEILPVLKDPAKRATVSAKMATYAETLGYARTELAQVEDHRAIVLLHKAMMWDEAQKAKPAIQQRIEKIKSATPVGGQKKSKSDLQERRQRLAKSGAAKDADAVFEAML